MGRTWDNDPQDSETRENVVVWPDFTLDYDTDDYMLMACGLCQFRRRVDYPVTMERLRQVAAEHLVDRHGEP